VQDGLWRKASTGRTYATLRVHPDFQGRGLGTAIIVKLKELSAGHRKIILYANPGKEGFYKKLGFTRMRTAMAIFEDQDRAIRDGLVDGP
jgi:ribosomal protein S18 acetylase RimI-like enzyme